MTQLGFLSVSRDKKYALGVIQGMSHKTIVFLWCKFYMVLIVRALSSKFTLSKLKELELIAIKLNFGDQDVS